LKKQIENRQVLFHKVVYLVCLRKQ